MPKRVHELCKSTRAGLTLRAARLWLTVLAAIAYAWAGAAQAALSLYFETEGWAYSEPVPIEAFADDWQAPLHKGSDAFAWLQAESGVFVDRWQFGWVFQRQYVIEASRDAARLYHIERNEQPALPNQQYDVSLRANYYQARGLRVGYSLPALSAGAWQFALKPSLVLWRGDRLEDGSLAGTAGTDADSELTFDATLDHAYSKDNLLARPVSKPRGRGASIDLAGHFTYGRSWAGEFKLRNLLGRMWWKNAPYTLGDLQSDNRQTDDTGRVNFDPTLSGFEGNRNHRQRLPLYADLQLRRAWGAHRAGLNLVYTDIGAFPGIGWDHGRDGLRYGLDWLPTARNAVQAHLSWRALRLRVGGNAWDVDELEQAQIQLGFEIPLSALWTQFTAPE